MYRTTRKERWYYSCALYQNSEAKLCNYNRLDGNGGVSFALWAIRDHFQKPELIERMKERLVQLANDRVGDNNRRGQDALEVKQHALKEDMKQAARNLARAKSDASFTAIEDELTRMKTELAQVELQLKSVTPVVVTDPQAEINAALAVLERLPDLIEKGAIDQNATENLFKFLDLRLYLNFRKHMIGRTTRNRIDGGIITFGQVPPPCPIYGGPTDRYIIKQMIANGEPVSPILGNGFPESSETGQSVGGSANMQRVTSRCT